MEYEEKFKQRKATIEKNRQRWNDMSKPFEMLKEGAIVIIDGEFKTFQGFIGSCQEENIIVDLEPYSGRGVTWEQPKKLVTLADSTLQSLDLHLYKTLEEKRKVQDRKLEIDLERARNDAALFEAETDEIQKSITNT